ncbi:MAG: hypothetical protein Q8L53_07755 [Aestuariivirga sp.]|nr:hypothetical protein [Aestuariivirga sp.]
MANRKEVHFKETTSEIGNLAVKWSYLEFVIERLIWVLAGFATYEECDIFLHNLDVRQKAQIAKSLAVLRPIDEKWKGKTITALDTASNEFRNARNETIHSRWFLSDKGTRRQRIKIRISKPQSYAPREITTLEEARPNLGAMKRISKSIEKLSRELELLHSYAGVWKGNQEGSQAISYAQFVRLVRSESRRRQKPKKA